MKKFSLRDIVLRPISPEEVSRWEYYLKKYHYLGYKGIPGESLRYVATIDSEWVALLGWGSAALKCKVRDEYLGWNQETKIKRLHLIANNVRFLILPWIHRKNLASRVLALNLKRLSKDWQEVYGHPLYLAETFVDLSLHKGSCYRASNWIYLGKTRGFSKCGKRYYENGKPKAVFVYPLHRKARKILKSDFFPIENNLKEGVIMSVNSLPIEGNEGLIEVIKKITDPRKPRGIRHPLSSILGMAICAVLCGARSYLAIAEWAKRLPSRALKRFGCRRSEPPSEPTFRRVLQSIDVQEFDRKIGNWLSHQSAFSGKAIAVDGKTVRGSGGGNSKPIHLLSAIVHKEGIVIAQKGVDEKTNEIKVVKPLLDEVDIKGATVTADALLTQKEIAKYIVEEKDADYLFTVKENQPTLLEDIKALKLESFSPSAYNYRQGSWKD